MTRLLRPLQYGWLAALAAMLAGCCSGQNTPPGGGGGPGTKEIAPPARLVVTAKPKDELVKAGEAATFTTEAQADLDKDLLSYQWLFDGSALDPATNATAQAKTLRIPAASTNSVGFYSCIVTAHDKRGETQPVFEITEPGQLTVYTDGSIIVAGTPIPGPASPSGSCPTPYVGYVNFRNPSSSTGGWTFDQTSLVHEAVDPNCEGARPKTQVKYWGNIILDRNCASERVPVTRQFGSTSFVFTVFFPRTAFPKVPPAPYILVLHGFRP